MKQPNPIEGKTDVTPLVIKDLEQRATIGLETYGKPLQTHNGRDALWDAYEEVLDLAQYLRQRIEEESSV